MTGSRILFIYNADAGFVPLMRDWLVKLFRPAIYPCRLCALTHGLFAMHGQWARTLAALPIDHVALYRDEWRVRYPCDETTLPAILLERDGERRLLVSAEDFADMADLDRLVALLHARLQAA